MKFKILFVNKEKENLQSFKVLFEKYNTELEQNIFDLFEINFDYERIGFYSKAKLLIHSSSTSNDFKFSEYKYCNENEGRILVSNICDCFAKNLNINDYILYSSQKSFNEKIEHFSLKISKSNTFSTKSYNREHISFFFLEKVLKNIRILNVRII